MGRRLLLAGFVLAMLMGGCIQVDVGTPSPGVDASSSGQVRQANEPGVPRVSYSSDPATPKAGQVVLFTLQATGLSSGDQVSKSSWLFGDGGRSTDRHPAHTFHAAGTYTVKVDVVTVKGAQAVHQATLRVLAASSADNGTADPGFPPAPDNATADNATSEPQPFEPQEPSGNCGTLGSFEPIPPNPLLVPGLATGWPLLRLDLALIADPSFVDAHPTDWQDLLRDLVADASVYYEAQVGLRLNASLIDRLPDGSLAAGSGDGLQRATARGFMHANHPNADVDAVAVILGSNYEGSVAGQVECVHGAAYPDYSYLWSEYKEERLEAPPAIGMFEDIPLKILMHELAHLLAAHHHYSTCGHPYLEVRTSDLTGICDVMINDIGLASFYFGPTNRLVMRSFVEAIGIGTPV